MIEQANTQKSLQSPSQRIQFNLTSHDLQCFMSRNTKSQETHKRDYKTKNMHINNNDSNPSNKNNEKPYIKLIQRLDQNPKRQKNTQNFPYIDRYFDHKVLFTKYGLLQVYVDQQLNNTQSTLTQQQDNNNIQNIDSQQVVSQCLRAINQDITNTNTNTNINNNNNMNNNNNEYQLQTLKYYNQQILDINNINRSRTKLSIQQPIFSIKPYETQIQYDGRTTLMLRNIPNKYTQQMVLQQVQSAGLEDKYDFFYLPIDFKNDCNVGYAFINLIDVQYVHKMYQKFNGKKWPRFNSQKICQVCYARIQGTPQLLNHFRFSNTLQRDNRYRPLIYVNLGLSTQNNNNNSNNNGVINVNVNNNSNSTNNSVANSPIKKQGSYYKTSINMNMENNITSFSA